MSRVVRSSKFRHVFGTVAKKEQCMDDIRITRTAWDTDLASANPKFIAVLLEAAGGGSFAVYPWTIGGKVDPKLPVVCGHKNTVLDIDWNPFNDYLIASASEDGYSKIWQIPEGGLTKNLDTPVQTLSGHKRKVGTCRFNPVANNILATSSTDFTVKIWDIERGDAVFSIDGHTDIISNTDWYHNGSLIASSSKDRKLRIIDPRQNKVVAEIEAHTGIKGFKAIWIGERVFTVGFSKTSEREYALWDPKSLTAPLIRQSIDSSSGSIMPFLDKDLNILYLAGKGDGNVRYYETADEAPYLYFLSEFKSNTPQRGFCALPKRALNVSDCEIDRLVKVGVKMLEPISFQVPRKSDIFQDDIYPDTFSGEPSLTSSEWISGKNAEQKKMSLAPGFVLREKAPDFNPVQKEEKVWTADELHKEVERLTNRVAYLEAELVKKDAKIKEIQG